MAGKIFIIGHKAAERGGSRISNGSRAAMREDENDFPVSTPPAVRRLIDAGNFRPRKQGLSLPDKINLYSTGTRFWSPGPNGQMVELIATGGRIDEKAGPAIIHNLNTLVGRFNPATNKFEPIVTQTKDRPQTAPAGSMK